MVPCCRRLGTGVLGTDVANIEADREVMRRARPAPRLPSSQTVISVATVVFCGDLVEESGDPVIDADSDLAAWPETLDRLLEAAGPEAVYVPGHGAVVDARFIRAAGSPGAANRRPTPSALRR